MSHPTVLVPSDAATAHRFGSDVPRKRFQRSVDIGRLEPQLKKAFAALVANKPYPPPDAPDADGRIHDQARILRLLYVCGAQAAIEVNATAQGSTGRPRTVTTVGRDAGCRERSSVDAAIAELCDSGLIGFARGSLLDPRRYEVIEDQPAVAKALRAGGARRRLRGTLCLTPLGDTLCRSTRVSCASVPTEALL
jgi:hypothetical protein